MKLVLFFRRVDTLAKAGHGNPNHDELGRFAVHLGEHPALWSSKARITLSRNQVLPGERLSDAAKRARKNILMAFALSGGNVRNSHSRDLITVTGASANHMLHLGDKHQPLRPHLEAAFCAHDLMRRAVLAERHPDRKDDNPNLYVARYYAPFSHDGMLYRCKLTVFEHHEPGGVFKLYDHALSQMDLEPVEKENPARGGVLRGPEYKEGLAGPPSSASDGALVAISPDLKISMAAIMRGVNRDGDGLPFGSPSR